MAWYNPATWSAVDKVQDAFSGNFGIDPTKPNSSTRFLPNNMTRTVSPKPSGNSQSKGNSGQQQSQVDPGASYGGGGSGGSGGGSGGGTSYDPAVGAYFDQLIGNINSSIGRLGNQEAIGRDNIINSYNSAYNRLVGQKAVAERDYNTNKVQTAQDNIKAKNGIDVSVGNQTNALTRLLGARGSGSSSASEIVAPWAAARQGTVQRNEVADTFARNNQALDTNFGDYKREWDDTVTDITRQKDNNLNTLQAKISTTRAELLNQIASLTGQKSLATGGTYKTAVAAMAPFQGQANDLMVRADNLGREFATPVSINKDVKYAAPDLEQYDYEQAEAPTMENRTALTDMISPYWNLIGKKQQNNLLMA